MSTSEKENFVTLAEAAKDTPHSQEYLSLLARRGKIKAKKIGRSWYTTTTAVNEYISLQKELLLKELALKKKSSQDNIKLSKSPDNLKINNLISKPYENLEPQIKNYFRASRSPLVFKGALVISVTGMFIFVSGAFAMQGFNKLAESKSKIAQKIIHAITAPFETADSVALAAAVSRQNSIPNSFAEFLGKQINYVVAGGMFKKFSEVGRGVSDFFKNKIVFKPAPLKPIAGIPAPAPVQKEIIHQTEQKITTTEKVLQLVKVSQVVEKKEILVPADLTIFKNNILDNVGLLNQQIKDQFETSINNLRVDLARTTSTAGSAIQMVNLTQRIDQLNNLTITNGATISTGNLAVNSGDISASGNISAGGGISGTSLTISSGLSSSAGTSTLKNLTVTSNTTLGTNAGDLATFNAGNLIFNNPVTAIIPTSVVALSIATSSSATPTLILDSANGRIGVGTSTPGQTLAVAGSGYFTGGVTLTRVPTIPHTFGTWSTGVANSNVLDSSFLINPASAASDTNLFGIAVAGSPKFLVDGDGDVFARTLTTEGSVTVGSTTVSSLLIQGTTYLGDSATNQVIFNAGNISFTNFATSTIKNSAINSFSIATSSTAVPFMTFDTLNNRIGMFTTQPNHRLDIGGNLVVTSTGSLGVGTTTPAAYFAVQGNSYFSGTAFFGGTLTATSTLNVSGLTTLGNASTTQVSSTNAAYFATSGGNVGVGTTSPTSVLEINQPTNVTNGLTVMGASGGTDAQIRALAVTANNHAFFDASGQTGITHIRMFASRNSADSPIRASTVGLWGISNHDMDFMTNNTVYMTLTKGGNVGIGTTSPVARLSVRSNVSGGEFITGTNSTTGQRIFAIFETSSSGGAGTMYLADSSGVIQDQVNAIGNTYFNGGNVGIGTTNPQSRLYVASNNGSVSGMANEDFANNTGGAYYIFNKTRGGSAGVQTIVQNGDTLGQIQWQGSDGSSFTASALIQAKVNGTPAAGSIPSDLQFFTGTTLTERMRILSGGNVGIGTTSPGALLAVAGTGYFTGNVGIGIAGGSSDEPLTIQGSNGELRLIDTRSDGSGPDTFLSSWRWTSQPAAGTVMGIAAVRANSSTGQDAVGVNLQMVVDDFTHATRKASLRFDTMNNGTMAEKLRIQYDGNVGIGVTAPARKLEVFGGTTAIASSTYPYISSSGLTNGNTFIGDLKTIGDRNTANALDVVAIGATQAQDQNNPTTKGVGIGFWAPSQSAGNGYNPHQDANIFAGNESVGYSGYLAFGTSLDTGGLQNVIERMRIDSAGNVGIGTTNPGSKLEVGGQLAVKYANPDVNGIYLNATTGTNPAAMQFANTGTNAYLGLDSSTGSRLLASGGTGGYQFVISTESAVPMVLGTNNVGRITILSGGNVGIGTTNPGSLLDVRGTAANTVGVNFQAAAGKNMQFTVSDGSATLYATARGGTGVCPGTGEIICFRSDGGGITFSSDSGTTNTMTLTTGNNVGIGTTNPTNQLELSLSTAQKSSGTTWSNPSDVRLKTNIYAFNDGLSVIKQINPVHYTLNGLAGTPAGQSDIGIVAQEILPIAPYTISTYDAKLNPDDATTTSLYRFNASALTFALINGEKNIAQVIDLINAPTTTPTIVIDSTGNIGIGTSTPGYKMQVMGDIAATSFVNISTQKEKKNISYLMRQDEKDILNKIKNISVATYNYLFEPTCQNTAATPEQLIVSGCTKRLGLIAEEAPPEVLAAGGKGVDVYKLSSFILAGVKEQQREIADLQSQVTDLASRIGSTTPGSLVANGQPWNVDMMNGKLNVYFTGNLNLQGNDLLDVGKISGYLGKWSIDQDGTMIAVKIITDELITKKLSVTDSVEIGTSAKPIGLTIYDEVTNQPYCLKMKNGAMVSESGSCVNIVPASAAPPDNLSAGATPTTINTSTGGNTSTTTTIYTDIQNLSASTTVQYIQATETATTTITTDLGTTTVDVISP